ncbi:MAG: cyclic nucleotide-binding domain-containing protein, partial [Proteobacteria bacterium]|nr:cyclic nucleotide-binding domain-containing protein [Pseudomonadota bacterium]
MGPIKNLVHDSDRESMDSERKQNQPKHQNKSDLLRFLAESSILSFLKSDADRNKILKKATIRKLADGECVCREGDDAERILIPLKGSSLDLFTGDLRKEPVHSGSVSEGRVVNFYSVIRHLPFQFTAVSSGEGQLLELAWADLRNELSKTPGMVEYFLHMTEMPMVRRLAKEMDDLNLGRTFKASLLGSVSMKILFPHQLIVSQDHAFPFAFVPMDGALNASRKKKASALSSV